MLTNNSGSSTKKSEFARPYIIGPERSEGNTATWAEVVGQATGRLGTGPGSSCFLVP